MDRDLTICRAIYNYFFNYGLPENSSTPNPLRQLSFVPSVWAKKSNGVCYLCGCHQAFCWHILISVRQYTSSGSECKIYANGLLPEHIYSLFLLN